MLLCLPRNALDIHMNPTSSWELHPQLEHDTLFLGDLPQSRVLLSKDANYPWLVLVPRRAALVEVTDLAPAEQMQLTMEINRAARALKDVTACDKLNIATLGNMVPQLHIHIIARRTTDPAWPQPIWGKVPPRDYEAAALDRLMTALRPQVGIA